MKTWALILIPVVLLSGCIAIGSNAYIGTYYLDKPNDYKDYTLTIQDDNTYLVNIHEYRFGSNNHTEKGVYAIKDDTIQITDALGYTMIMKHSGVNLTDQDGYLWIKQ